MCFNPSLHCSDRLYVGPNNLHVGLTPQCLTSRLRRLPHSHRASLLILTHRMLGSLPDVQACAMERSGGMQALWAKCLR